MYFHGVMPDIRTSFITVTLMANEAKGLSFSGFKSIVSRHSVRASE